MGVCILMYCSNWK